MSTFDAGGFLKEQGIELAGEDSTGQPIFKLPNGETRPFDVNGFLKSKGVPVDKFSIELNSPADALEESPVSFLDRAALAAGDEKGRVNYLKNKFQAVQFDDNKGLVVKDKSGLWKTVDPSGVTNPQEFAKDLIDNVFTGAQIAGGVGAAALAAPSGPGAVAAAGAAGGGIEAGRIALGKILGTYAGTAEDIAKDVAFETVTSLAPEAAFQGAKAGYKAVAPSIKRFTDGFKSIGSTASEGTKELMTDILSKTTGATPQATRMMIDNADEVGAELAKYKGLTQQQIVSQLKDEQIKVVDTLLEDAPKALTRKFGELKSALVSQAKNMGEVDLGEIATQGLKTLSDSGIIAEVPMKSGRKAFRILTPKEMADKGVLGEALSESSRNQLQKLVKEVNQFSTLGKSTGPDAAAKLMDLKRAVNAFYDDLPGDMAPSAVRVAQKLRADTVNAIGDSFSKAGLAEPYLATGQVYQRYADAVQLARKTAKQDKGSEILLDQLVSGAGKNQTFKGLAQDMIDLTGNKDALNTLMKKHAAQNFSTFLPRAGLAANIGTAGVGAAIATGDIDPVSGGAIAGLALLSPKMVLKTTQASSKLLGFLKGMSPAAKAAFLQDENAVRTAFQTLANSQADQEQMTQELLKGSGL